MSRSSNSSAGPGTGGQSSSLRSFFQRFPFLASSACALLFTLLTVAVLYLPVCGFDFSIIDDSSNVYANRFICHPDSQNIAYLWRHTYYDLYMPLTYTIWAFCARIAPLAVPIAIIREGEPTIVNPYVFHTANLIFHVANTAVVFGILRRLRFGAWACAVGALLFALHPVQVESVAWVTGMNNLTSGFFGFLAIFFYLQQVPVEDPAGTTTLPSRRRSYLYLSMATLSFTAALLSKPIATCIPIFIFVLEAVAFRRPIRRWAAPLAVWLVLSCVCIEMTRLASRPDKAFHAVLSPLWGRPFVVGDALAFYFVKLFFPYSLAFDYARNPPTVLHSWWGYVTWILPVFIFLVLFIHLPARFEPLSNFREMRHWIGVSALLFVAAILPTSGIVPYYSEGITTVNDRFLYLAMLGPAIAVAYLLSRPVSALRPSKIVPVALVAGFAYLTTQEIPVWRNMYSLTNDMLDSAPRSSIAHECLGIVYENVGNWPGAYKEFQTAERLQYQPTPSTDDSIGLALFHLNRFDDAISHFEHAIRGQPDDNAAWFQLWFIFTKLHRYKEAEAFVRSRIAAYPDDDRAKFTLGLILMQQNRPADALPYVELAAKSDPDSGDAQYYVGVVLQKLGRYDEAERFYKHALDLDPKNPDAMAALAGIRRILGH